MSDLLRLLALSLCGFLALLTANPAAAHGPEEHENAEHAVAQATPAPAAEPSSATKAGEGAHSVGSDVEDGGWTTIFASLHPASVHFPIAFFLLAGLLEAYAAARRRADLSATVDVLIWAGAIGAVVAAGLGWVHTGIWFGGETIMQWHRWMGTALALAGLVAVALVGDAGARSRAPLRILLGLICLALLVQGYWGAELAHGPDHLDI